MSGTCLACAVRPGGQVVEACYGADGIFENRAQKQFFEAQLDVVDEKLVC